MLRECRADRGTCDKPADTGPHKTSTRRLVAQAVDSVHLIHVHPLQSFIALSQFVIASTWREPEFNAVQMPGDVAGASAPLASECTSTPALANGCHRPRLPGSVASPRPG